MSSSRAEQLSSPRSAPLRISLFYSDGLSARSGDKPQDLWFLPVGCQLTFLVTNMTKRDICLWRPFCPEGDHAIRFEFKTNENSKQIGVAQSFYFYTGGSGVTQTMKLVPGDSVVYQVDFSSRWSLPFVLDPGASANMLVRAVYESQSVDLDRTFVPSDAEKVWHGRVATGWERVRVLNRTDSKVPDFYIPESLRGVNLLK